MLLLARSVSRSRWLNNVEKTGSTPRWCESEKNRRFLQIRLAPRFPAPSVHAMLPDLDGRTHTHGAWVRPSKKNRASAKRFDRKAWSKTDLRAPRGRRTAPPMLHEMLHALPCLPRDRAAALLAQPCSRATKVHFYCADAREIADY